MSLLMTVFFSLVSWLLCSAYRVLQLVIPYTRNGKPWYSLGIIVITFYTIQYFLTPFNRNGIIIVTFSLLVILFVGRMFYLRLNNRWNVLGYQEDRETSSFLTKTTIVFSIIFATTTWGVPFLNNKISNRTDLEIITPNRDYTQSWERIKNFFYPLRPRMGIGDGLFPETFSLGQSRSLDEEIVLQVHILEKSSHNARYYWKARIYSSYENGFWGNESLEYSSLDKLALNPNLFFNNELLNYTFIYKNKEKVLITPQIVIDVDRDVKVEFFSDEHNKQDVISISNYGLVRNGDQITVLGGYYDFRFDNQTTTENEYPDWVQSRYLSLPEGFSSAIRDLAIETTQNESSVFDQVSAVTRYMRNNYKYKDKVNIPKGEDPLEWFLFNGREGFCNYFASAEIMMLRSLGIPSRMVVGYAQGEHLKDKNIYQVKKKDSHSWVEVFFPEYGWIIFEPTPSQPRILYKNEPIPDYEIENQENQPIKETEDTQNFHQLDDFDKINDLLNERATDKKATWKYLLWTLPFFMLFLIIFSGHQLIILRRRPVLIPIAIQRILCEREKKVPKWIKNWADYEQLSILEKNFQVLKYISIALGISKDSIQTPKEFLLELFSVIDQNGHYGLGFMEKYHQEKYGNKKIHYSEEIRASYLKIIKSIVFLKISWMKSKISIRI